MINAKQVAVALALLAAPALLTACKDSNSTPDDPNDTFGATINGGQEVPPVSTTAAGTYSANYNRVTRVLNYTVTHQGLTPTAGHIHSVTATTAEGNTGGVSIDFKTALTSPIVGSTTLTQAQQDEMYGRRTYVNLHSAKFPSGEIRGNIRQTD